GPRRLRARDAWRRARAPAPERAASRRGVRGSGGGASARGPAAVDGELRAGDLVGGGGAKEKRHARDLVDGHELLRRLRREDDVLDRLLAGDSRLLRPID